MKCSGWGLQGVGAWDDTVYLRGDLIPMIRSQAVATRNVWRIVAFYVSIAAWQSFICHKDGSGGKAEVVYPILVLLQIKRVAFFWGERYSVRIL